MSASIGSLDASAAPNLDAMRRPTGYPYPIGLTPQQVRSIYGFSDAKFGGIVGDGSGQTIAIVAAYNNPNIVNDLTTFDRSFGLSDPPSFTIVNQNGGSKLPKNNRGWASEIALDVEWAHAIAPGASILLVEAKSASTFGTAIDYARHAPGVTVLSVSAAGKEFKQERSVDALFTTPAGHLGVTFVFASGDEGGKPKYPSSSPNVLNVGGTSLNATGTSHYYGEIVWSGGGGGISKYEGVPSYQNGLGLSARGTPDVAYDGDPESGFAVFDSYGSGGWAQFGGTSAGTPQWAALLAIANQGRALAGKSSLANAQAALYALPRSDFHDIIFGSNGFSASTGYDLATGLGSPIANLLIPDLVAYSGSIDFTVTAIASGKLTTLTKHLTSHSLSIAATGTQFEYWSDNSVVMSRRDSVATSFDISRRLFEHSALSFAIDSLAPASSMARNRSSTKSNWSSLTTAVAEYEPLSGALSKLSRPPTYLGDQFESSPTLGDQTFAGIDAYFAELTSAMLAPVA